MDNHSTVTYGSIPSDERPATYTELPPPQSTMRRFVTQLGSKSVALVYLPIALVGMLVGISTFHSLGLQRAMKEQQVMITNMQQQLIDAQLQHSNAFADLEQIATEQSSAIDELNSKSKSLHGSKAKKLPSKYAIDYTTPRKSQAHRGTCWAFATIGVLEQSYRQHGVEKGWLKPEEYVSFSEQAFAKKVVELCSGNLLSAQQLACRVAGNSIWENTTEGGDATELWYLKNGLMDSVLPTTVCPYFENLGHDLECPGMNATSLSTNPLSFELKDMGTYYTMEESKTRLFQGKQAMALGTSSVDITTYYPCIGKYANDPRCDPNGDQCHLCPSHMPMTPCCIALTKGSSSTMEGEFVAHQGMTLGGGHAMVFVGYNDYYRSKDGFEGGFILKNSWADSNQHGSHTISYFMDDIYDWEERTVCPNSASPYNWYKCGNAEETVTGDDRDNKLKNKMVAGAMGLAAGQKAEQNAAFDGTDRPVPKNFTVTAEDMHAFVHNPTSGNAAKIMPMGAIWPIKNFDRSNANQPGVKSCLSQETRLFAATNIQPLHLKCTNQDYCNTDEDTFTYFAQNMTDWGDRMVRMCMFEYNEKTKDSRNFCLPPHTVVEIGKFFRPVEFWENDPQKCGFYFYPYEVGKQIKMSFQGFYTNDYDIKWHKQSYAANEHLYPELDYTELKKSTKTQRSYSFNGPFPFAHVVG